jgi:hypothetical protein
MPVDRFNRRLSYLSLFITPFLVFVVGAVRAQRISGVYHSLEAVLITAISVSAWKLDGWRRHVRLARISHHRGKTETVG